MSREEAEQNCFEGFKKDCDALYKLDSIRITGKPEKASSVQVDLTGKNGNRRRKKRNFYTIQFIIYDLLLSDHISSDHVFRLVVDEEWPNSDIRVCPCADKGISVTFPHQSLNSAPKRSWQTWREGDLCLTDPFVRSAGFPSHNEDDFVSLAPAGKLIYKVERAVLWARLASENCLSRPGDPFELPALPPSSNNVVFFESSKHFISYWKPLLLNENGKQYAHGFVKSTKDHRRTICRDFVFNEAIQQEVLPRLGDGETYRVALALKNHVFCKPWGTPTRWKELEEIVSKQAPSFKKMLQEPKPPRKRNITTDFFLLGFPIPKRVEEEPSEFHWLAIEYPPLLQSGRLARNFYKDVVYIKTENWDKTRLIGRGAVKKKLQDMHIVLFGYGALGSSIIELLVRMGVDNITVIDDDILRSENLVRHTASLSEIDKTKSNAAKIRLTNIRSGVNVTVESERTKFQPARDRPTLLLDCTAEISNWKFIAQMPADQEFHYCCLWLGREGKYLYRIDGYGRQLVWETFEAVLACEKSMQVNSGAASTNDFQPAGCWHPAAKIRYDDIQLWVALIVHSLENLVLSSTSRSDGSIYKCSHQNEELTPRIKKIFPCDNKTKSTPPPIEELPLFSLPKR